MKLKVYIELDSIFDTRLPIIEEVVPVDKDYLNRTTDNFKFIGEKEFEIMYKHRDRYILSKSKPTLMLKELNIITNLLIKENEGVNVEIVINIFPYELMAIEMEKYIIMLEEMFPYCSISMVRKKPTYELLINFNTVIKYDGLKLFESALRHNPNALAADTTLIVPAISSKYAVGVNLIEELKAFMKRYNPLLNIVFYDTIYWSYHE